MRKFEKIITKLRSYFSFSKTIQLLRLSYNYFSDQLLNYLQQKFVKVKNTEPNTVYPKILVWTDYKTFR